MLTADCDLTKSFVGLPLETTEEEFLEMMSKFGIIMQDPDTSKPKKIPVILKVMSVVVRATCLKARSNENESRLELD